MKPKYQSNDIVLYIGNNDPQNELNHFKGCEFVIKDYGWADNPLRIYYAVKNFESGPEEDIQFLPEHELQPTEKKVESNGSSIELPNNVLLKKENKSQGTALLVYNKKLMPLYQRGDVVLVVGNDDIEDELNTRRGEELVVHSYGWNQSPTGEDEDDDDDDVPLEIVYLIEVENIEDIHDGFYFVKANSIKPTGKKIEMGPMFDGTSITVSMEEDGTSKITSINLPDEDKSNE